MHKNEEFEYPFSVPLCQMSDLSLFPHENECEKGNFCNFCIFWVIFVAKT